MIRFHAPDIAETNTLPETESAHCCRVLRMKAGDILFAVDGIGNVFECRITDPSPKATEVEILSVAQEPKHWKPFITLAVAPTKNIDRIEWLFEKATEIGVDRLVLLRCEHSERKDVKPERLNKILVSAMKQSMKATLPLFDGMLPFRQFMKEADNSAKFMGYCSESFPRVEFARSCPSATDITVLIGPEGDFSPQEVEWAVAAGYRPVTFGNTRLRTETAALYALSAIHIINDLNR